MSEKDTIQSTSLFEAGGLGADSLFARFDFTRDALLSAVSRRLESIRSGSPGEMPAELRTYVHELTHYVQYTTTPYGLFLNHCRKLQNHATIDIVQTLLASKGGFKMPLLQNLPELSGESEATLRRGLALWLNVENLVATLAGDVERQFVLMKAYISDNERYNAGLSPRMPPLLLFPEAFARVQESLVNLATSVNRSAEQIGNKVPMFCPISAADRLAISDELADKTWMMRNQNRTAVSQQFAFDMTVGNQWNIEAMIESAATAAEFWGSDISYDQFVAWVDAPVDPRLKLYRNWIGQALPSIKSRDLFIVIPTYLALCELALSAPLLPQHAALRRQKSDLEEILPTQRWIRLMSTAEKVRPMNGRTDYSRYVTDLCSILGWVNPLQIAKTALDGPTMVSEPLSQIYYWSQRYRAFSSGDFIGLDRYLLEDTLEASEWQQCFNFVIVDYADLTTYHSDKDFLRAMTTRVLEMLGLRCIMEGRQLLIKAPYRGDEAERQWMTDWLQERFKSLFDHDFPMLQVVAAD